MRTFSSMCRWIADLGARSLQNTGWARRRPASGGAWLGLVGLFLLQGRSWVTATACSQITRCYYEACYVISEKKICTNTLTFSSKIKGPLLSFIFLALWSPGSQVATCASFGMEMGGSYQLKRWGSRQGAKTALVRCKATCKAMSKLLR